jgi:hypothetical protein
MVTARCISADTQPSERADHVKAASIEAAGIRVAVRRGLRAIQVKKPRVLSWQLEKADRRDTMPRDVRFQIRQYVTIVSSDDCKYSQVSEVVTMT